MKGSSYFGPVAPPVFPAGKPIITLPPLPKVGSSCPGVGPFGFEVDFAGFAVAPPAIAARPTHNAAITIASRQILLMC